MARDAWAYREVAVESVIDPRTGRLQIRPLGGQAISTGVRVQCSRRLLDYPPGTRFLLSAKFTDRMGGEPFLYAWHGDPVKVLSKAAANRFLQAYRRLRL